MKDRSHHREAALFILTSASSIHLSASTTPTSVSSTPTSALLGRSSPKSSSSRLSLDPIDHSCGQSEITNPPGYTRTLSHGQGKLEAAIMNRGRPMIRANDMREDGNAPSQGSASLEEKKGFEELPHGCLAIDAPSMLAATNIEALRKQAVDQASRFEVLSPQDVDALARVHPTFLPLPLILPPLGPTY